MLKLTSEQVRREGWESGLHHRINRKPLNMSKPRAERSLWCGEKVTGLRVDMVRMIRNPSKTGDGLDPSSGHGDGKV